MYTRDELQDAINQLTSSSHHSIQNCEKLAAVYTVLDHMEEPPARAQIERGYSYEDHTDVVGEYGKSDFLRSVSGKSALEVWKILDEMMDAVSVFNPKLHRAVLSRISALDDKIIN